MKSSFRFPQHKSWNEIRFANHKSTDIIIIYRASDISCAMNNYDLLSLIDREDIDVIYDDLNSHTRLHPHTYFANCAMVYMALCTSICMCWPRMPMLFDQCSNDGRNCECSCWCCTSLGPFSFTHFNLPSVDFGTFMAEHVRARVVWHSWFIYLDPVYICRNGE